MHTFYKTSHTNCCYQAIYNIINAHYSLRKERIIMENNNNYKNTTNSNNYKNRTTDRAENRATDRTENRSTDRTTDRTENRSTNRTSDVSDTTSDNRSPMDRVDSRR